MTAAMHHMTASVQKIRNLEREQRLIVSVESSLATAWLVPKLEEFRDREPHVTVLIDSSQQIVDLHRSAVDIAIRYGVEDNKDLIVNRLFDDQIFPACSPSLAQGPPRIGKLEDLKNVTLIHWDLSQLEWAQATRKWFGWESWLAQVGAHELITGEGLHFSDYGLAVQAAIAGQGMVLASWPILREAVDAQLLVCPFREKVTTDIGYDIVTTGLARNRPEVNAFIDWILEAAGRE